MCIPGPGEHRLLRLGRPEGLRSGGGHPVPLARSAAAPAVDDKCPDGKTSCNAAATCCALRSGGYACCPEANAVCCPDHIHCCPQGTKCDVKHRTCLKVQKHPILTLL
ncbi:Granulin [Amphibalanus amphitrite]|uniref:Granulin n=2 Tax=Amphibalanus amphitrite TaxID=1232801 RepID=A0A6A4WEG4_AMPAM|nr:Granulin [Amphibalanus amphitrite]